MAPALQGDNGLSPKSGETGNASYYYSLSRLNTTGTITLGDEAFEISGTSWMDHEFSTSALGLTALGWDWFGLQFDDGRDLMAGQIRLVTGGREPAFGGMLVPAGIGLALIIAFVFHALRESNTNPLRGGGAWRPIHGLRGERSLLEIERLADP